MASLRQRRNKWYSRIQTLGQKEINIPLNTSNKNTARIRHAKVEKVEKDIKNRVSFEFPWKNDNGGLTTIKQISLEKSVDRWLKIINSTTSEEHYKRCKISMDRLMDVLGYNSPISSIMVKDIEDFKCYWKDRHKVAGINLNLRNIKIFLNWCCENELVSKAPKIKMLKESKKLPQYLIEYQWNQLMALETLSLFMKRAFSVYRSTGCRRREIIDGILDNHYLIVPADISKSRVEYHIKLEAWQIEIINEIHHEKNVHLQKGSSLVTFKNKFTKSFKDACKEIGINANFHCLRHTFAVMKYLLTKDIYQVKIDLHHTSVKTTEIYALFDINKLKEDFPSLSESSEQIEKIQKKIIQDTVFQDTGNIEPYNPPLLN